MRSLYQHKSRKPLKRPALLFLVLLALWLLLSPYGLWRYAKVSGELKELRAESQRLETQNRELLTEITRLQNDPAYIEEVARREYGLLKENEILFDFRRSRR